MAGRRGNVNVYQVSKDDDVKKVIIRKTCPCNECPNISHFYIAKLGYAGVNLFFLFLLQTIEIILGEAILTCTHYLCFGQK